jgi:hypothetical protein
MIWLATAAPRRTVFLLLAFAANLLFALGYNVGDVHVFLLPSHFFVLLFAGAGILALQRAAHVDAVMVACLGLTLVGARIYRDYPALDRSGDHRPTELLTALTSSIDDRHAIFVTDLNWQIQNGLAYFARRVRPDVAYVRMPDVALYAPALIRDNQVIGRDVVLSEHAAMTMREAYGPLVEISRDARLARRSLDEVVASLPNGTRYVLCVLREFRDDPLDAEEIRKTLQALGGAAASPVITDDYFVMAGQVGQSPDMVEASARPFHASATIGAVPLRVRMDSWLAFDTIRRMGFGHAIAGRSHTLILERGVSFAAFDERGEAIRVEYRGNVFEPSTRYLITRR